MRRLCAMRLAAVAVSLAVAAGALAGSACDRVVNLTPPTDASPLNDGEPPPDTEAPPDTLPLPDALVLDAVVVAPDGGIDGAATAGEPGR